MAAIIENRPDLPKAGLRVSAKNSGEGYSSEALRARFFKLKTAKRGLFLCREIGFRH